MIDFYLFQVSIPLVWLAAGIIISSTEFIIPTNLSIWPGIAAAMVASLIAIGFVNEYSFVWQFFWFAIFTILLTLLWFLVITKYTSLGRRTSDEHRDATLFDLRGVVTETVKPGRPGKVELFSAFHGIKDWKAESDQTIEPETEISVLDSDGIKLIVKKIEGEYA